MKRAIALTVLALASPAHAGGWDAFFGGVGKALQHLGEDQYRSALEEERQRQFLEQQYRYQQKLLEQQHQHERQLYRPETAYACVSPNVSEGALVRRASDGRPAMVKQLIGYHPQCPDPLRPVAAVIILH